MRTLVVPAISKLLAIVVAVICLVLGPSTGLQLDLEGNYQLTVGIISGDDPTGAYSYVENIKVEMSKLSHLLYEQSNGKFLIKSVVILLPLGWADQIEKDSQVIPGTGESFHTSDVKISTEYFIPEVIRATQCGHPGDVLKLPFDFFESTNATLSYRAKDKALLHLWAEYRWGAFEEFGFPGNPRFPYFVNQEGQTEWEVSSCTNARLEGSFQFPNGTTCPTNDEDFPPKPECSFNPDPVSNSLVKSSLMSQFYWLDSMDSFCTSENHNKYLPNRHNLFCGYQSVQQVLQNSLDWTKVIGNKTPKNSKQFSEPEYTFVKPVEKPLVYLLIDSRSMAIPNAEVAKIRTELSKLFDLTSGLDSELVLALARYPGSVGPDDLFQFYEELVPWNILSNQRENFTRLLEEAISQGDDSADGFFGLAIKEISIQKIGPLKHDQGAFIFVLKSSPTTNYDAMPFEEDVLSSLQGQKVKLFSVEVSSSSVFDKGVNLKRLAEETGGAHLTLTTSSDIESKLPSFIGDFVKEANSGRFDRNLSTTVFKNLIQSTETTKVKYTSLGLRGTVKLTLTSDLPILSYSVKNLLGEEVTLEERPEWEEQLGRGRRTTYFSNLNMDDFQGLSISFQCSVVCSAFLTITFQGSNAAPYEASVSTSAVEGYFDAARIPSGVLSIYAKVEHFGTPLTYLGVSPPEASATVCLRSDPQRCWSVSLYDNGAGFPDLLSNDGILSGGWVPPEDGQFYTRISIKYSLPTESSTARPWIQKNIHQNVTQLSGKYLGDGDSSLPCSVSGEPQNCIGFTPDADFNLVADLPGFITVVNSDLFQGGVPTRVMDLGIVEAEGSQVTLKWTTPTVFLPNGEIARAESYQLKYCPSFDAALDLFETCSLIDELGNPETEPGRLQTFTYEMTNNDQTYYFGIWSLYQETFSEVSNIVWQTPNKRPITLPPATSPTTPGTTEPDLDTTEPDTRSTEPDTGTTEPDTGSTEPDTGSTEPDTGTTEPDTATAEPDTGSTEPDLSSTEPDNGSTGPELGTTQPDSSTTEAGPETTDPFLPTDNTESTTDIEYSSTSDDTPTEPTTPPLPQSTTQAPVTTSPTLLTTEPYIYFFKRTEGYITAGAVAIVVVTGIGGLLSYLCWKRHTLITKAAHNSAKRV